MAKKSNEMSGWVGWIGFAAFMLMLAGFFHLIVGFVGLFQEDVYVQTTNAIWAFDYSQWGWIHIFGGFLAILAAGSLMSGNAFGRIFAVLVAVASAVANMAFVPTYPIWSLLIITIDILVIYAVIVHGDEMKSLE